MIFLELPPALMISGTSSWWDGRPQLGFLLEPLRSNITALPDILKSAVWTRSWPLWAVAVTLPVPMVTDKLTDTGLVFKERNIRIKKFIKLLRGFKEQSNVNYNENRHAGNTSAASEASLTALWKYCGCTDPTPAPPGCQRAVGPPPSQKCASGADSWGTGRRSCSAPGPEPAGRRDGAHAAACPTLGMRIKASAQITGTLTFLNISAPLRASSRARSWGVDTMTAPDNTDADVNVERTRNHPVLSVRTGDTCGMSKRSNSFQLQNNVGCSSVCLT